MGNQKQKSLKKVFFEVVVFWMIYDHKILGFILFHEPIETHRSAELKRTLQCITYYNIPQNFGTGA
jgi:hypothetical protein